MRNGMETPGGMRAIMRPTDGALLGYEAGAV